MFRLRNLLNVQHTLSGATCAERSSARPAFHFILRGIRNRYKWNHAKRSQERLNKDPSDLETPQSMACFINYGMLTRISVMYLTIGDCGEQHDH